MCLYPKLIRNRKYTATKKNGGDIPPVVDERILYVPIGCGNCIECRKQKAREWQVRLAEELKTTPYAYFVTLTFEPEKMAELVENYNIEKCNELATKAVRLFTERYRKIYKKAPRHWLITELGQDNTERVHLHGILFMQFPINNEWLTDLWKYGITDTGKYCNMKTINYIIKYVYKIDEKHKDYKPKIFASRGLGKGYITDFAKRKHNFDGKITKDFYTLPNGNKIALPIYYRNKLFTEEEKEKLWIQRIEQDTRYIMGVKIDKVNANFENTKRFFDTLKKYQQLNKEMGFGNDEWQKKDYKITLQQLKKSRKPNSTF